MYMYVNSCQRGLNWKKRWHKGKTSSSYYFSPSSSLASARMESWGGGTFVKKLDQVTKKINKLRRKIISGLDLICQHVVIVHFDFFLSEMEVDAGRGAGGGAVVGGQERTLSCGVVESPLTSERLTKFNLNILLQPKQIMLLQPVGEANILQKQPKETHKKWM